MEIKPAIGLERTSDPRRQEPDYSERQNQDEIQLPFAAAYPAVRGIALPPESTTGDESENVRKRLLQRFQGIYLCQ